MKVNGESTALNCTGTKTKQTNKQNIIRFRFYCDIELTKLSENHLITNTGNMYIHDDCLQLQQKSNEMSEQNRTEQNNKSRQKNGIIWFRDNNE